MKIIVICGDKNAGKTTFVQHLIKKFNDEEIEVEGFVSVSEYSNDLPINYFICDISGKSKHHLCSMNPINDSIKYGRFFFRSETLKYGNQILQSAKPDKVVIVDEVGKMELVHEIAWFESLSFLIHHNFLKQIWVVRKDFIPLLSSKFTNVDFLIIDMNDPDAEKRILQIIKS